MRKTRLLTYLLLLIALSFMLNGCQKTTQSTQEIQALEDEIIQLKTEIELLQTDLAQVSNHLQETIESNPALKVNDLYNKAGLEDAVLELTEKNVLTFEELEFQVKALGKVDWDVFYSKAAELNKTIEPDPETGCIMFDYAEFKFLADYPNYNKSDLLSIQKAYTHSDASYSINFAWTLYDLHNKFSTESEFLYENNEAYRNTIDSFTDENGDIIIP